MQSLKLKKERGDPKYRYPLENGPGVAIGYYELMFNEQSSYIYRVRKDIDSFFIRRANFKKLLDSSEDLSVTKKNMQKLILHDYIEQIYKPIQEY